MFSIRLQVMETRDFERRVFGASGGGAFGQTTPRANMLHDCIIYITRQYNCLVPDEFEPLVGLGRSGVFATAHGGRTSWSVPGRRDPPCTKSKRLASWLAMSGRRHALGASCKYELPSTRLSDSKTVSPPSYLRNTFRNLHFR